jgi:cytochrome b subunit of formate dehydrogenase
MNQALTKANRLSAWLLFFLVAVFIITGFSMVGQYGFNRVVSKSTALQIHLRLAIPLIVLFLFHSLVCLYSAFQRWGWIKK